MPPTFTPIVNAPVTYNALASSSNLTPRHKSALSPSIGAYADQGYRHAVRAELQAVADLAFASIDEFERL